MKMQRTQRNQRPSSTKRYLQRRSYGLETLETRNLLAANVLASETGEITSTRSADTLSLDLDLPMAGPATTATLQIIVTPTDGTFDPAPVTIADELGNPISGMTTDNMSGSLASMTVVDLTEGTYNLTVMDAGTTGAYRIDVSLLGDVEASDSSVSGFEELRASAALVQAQGTGNFVTALYYRTRGIDLNISQYDAGLDANMNGAVDPAELSMVQANALIGPASVILTTDAEAPVLGDLALADDTGVPNDQITTNADLTLDVVEEETSIESVLVSLNGGAEVEVRDMLGTGAITDVIEIPQSVLESVNGGSLPEGPTTVSVRVADARDNVADPETISFVFIGNNQAPTSSGIADMNATEDSPFTFDASSAFSDANSGDVLTFSLGPGSPTWLSISESGTLSGTPLNDDVGPNSVSVVATDSQLASVTETFTTTVINTNDAPTISNIADQTTAVDALFSLDIYSFVDDVDADDIVGDNVTVSVDQFTNPTGEPVPEALPAWLNFDMTTGILSGTPGESDEGTIMIVVRAVDADADADRETFNISVVDNDPPVLNTPIADQDIREDDPFSLNLNDFFSDPDPEDTIVFSGMLVGGGALPAWLNLNGATGVLSGTPENDDVGTINVEVTAADAAGLSASDQFMITVNNVNDAPLIEDQSFTVATGATNGTVVGTIQATDVDVGDVLTFSVIGGDGQAAFAVDSATGEITITDDTLAFTQNQFTLNVNVTDNQVTSNATIRLNTVNTDPTANNDPSGFDTLNSSSLTISADDVLSNDTDPENDTLTITSVSGTSAEGATVTLSEDGSSISYDPSSSTSLQALASGASMTDTFTYTISDGRGGTDSATVTVTVTGSSAIVQFTMAFENLDGNSVTTVAPGQEFNLVVSVQDIRTDPTGVFSAFVDVNYPAALVSVDGTFQHSTTYSAGTSGSSTLPGLLDEVGGTDGISPLGGDVFEVFRIQMQAGTNPGTVDFTGDIADDTILHPVTVFLGTAALAEDQVDVVGASLTIAGSAAPLGFSQTSPGTNPDNMYDVDGNGVISPMDALMLINELNGGNTSYAGIIYSDVNGDGVTSPLDALLVIGELNTGTPQAPMSGAVSSGNNDPAASDAVYADLGDDVALNNPVDSGSLGSGSVDSDDEAETDEAIRQFGDEPF